MLQVHSGNRVAACPMILCLLSLRLFIPKSSQKACAAAQSCSQLKADRISVQTELGVAVANDLSHITSSSVVPRIFLGCLSHHPCPYADVSAFSERLAHPQVWSKTHSNEGSGESGAVARLHSALIAVLTHLVSRMGAQAASHSEVPEVQPGCLVLHKFTLHA